VFVKNSNHYLQRSLFVSTSAMDGTHNRTATGVAHAASAVGMNAVRSTERGVYAFWSYVRWVTLSRLTERFVGFHKGPNNLDLYWF